MKWALYNLLFAVVYPLLLPGFLLRMFRRGGYAARLGDRFALYPSSLIPHRLPLTARRSDYVWIHAVSVGEVQVAGQLMREWRAIEPGVRFVFSTTSSTGWKIAEKEVKKGEAGEGDVLIYNPLDFPNFVKSALKTFKPRAILLTESEIWPNFIMTAKRYQIPLFLINARVSDRSAPRYRLGKFFFKEVLGAFTKIFAQSELDAERLRAAMREKDQGKVVVTGSFKFDVAHRNEAKEQELTAWLHGAMKSELPPVLLGGSTWPGEDEVLLKIYRSLLKVSPKMVLVIAPRHFEKADAVEANIRAAGFECCRRSRDEAARWGHRALPSDEQIPVYLADTTGELMGLYGIADYVFVGKSLCEHGSQNMIEPCLCGKPTFVGPYTENFRPVMSDLLAADALIQVADAEELERRILEFASNKEKAQALGERATKAVERRRGVVAKCVSEIRSAL